MTEKEILEQSIKEHQAAIDKAKKDLAALGKPELRHGDYGTDWIVLQRKHQLEVFGTTQGSGSVWGDDRLWPCKEDKLGNIFDDLKRNSEDLDAFEIASREEREEISGRKIRVEATFYGAEFWCGVKSDRRFCELDFEGLDEFYQKLGQLIATAKREIIWER